LKWVCDGWEQVCNGWEQVCSVTEPVCQSTKCVAKPTEEILESGWDNTQSALSEGIVTVEEVKNNVVENYNTAAGAVLDAAIATGIEECLANPAQCAEPLMNAIQECLENPIGCFNALNTWSTGYENIDGHSGDFYFDAEIGAALNTYCRMTVEAKWKETILGLGSREFFTGDDAEINHKYSECTVCLDDTPDDNEWWEGCPNELLHLRWENPDSTLHGSGKWRVNATGLASMPEVEEGRTRIESFFSVLLSEKLAQEQNLELWDGYESYQRLKQAYGIGGATYAVATADSFSAFWSGALSSSTVALKAAEIMLDAYMYAKATRKLEEEVDDIADDIFPGFASAINFQVRNFILGRQTQPLTETVYSGANIHSFEILSYDEWDNGDREVDFTFTDENGDVKRLKINF